MFRLAHISDPHLAGWRRPGPGDLFSKRFFGYLSWRLRRQRVHLTSILEATVADLKAAAPDHIVITGDIVNISLPDEFARATHWLAGVGTPQMVTVIPGNHDAYIPLAWQSTIGQWAAYMTDDAVGTASAIGGSDSFPFVRQRDGVALIGVSSACPMPLTSAGGRLGGAQIERLRAKLVDLGRRDLFRILLIHHPPFEDPHHRRKGLEDIADLRRAIGEAGVELILHGHTHRSSLNRIEVPNGSSPVIGVASASARAWRTKDAARHHLYTIRRAGDGWQLEVEIRSLNATRDGFERTSLFRLSVPMAGTAVLQPGAPAAA
jgi:3',5'-cyclic AMP phosphodiesterase CpdA